MTDLAQLLKPIPPILMETIPRFIDYTTVLKRDIRPTESAVTLHPTDQATSLTELRYIHVIKYQFIYSFLILLMTQLERTLLCLYFPA